MIKQEIKSCLTPFILTPFILQITGTGTYTRTDGTTGNMADVNLIMDRFKREFANKLDTSSVTHLPDMQGSGVLRDLREAANDGDWRVVA